MAGHHTVPCMEMRTLHFCVEHKGRRGVVASLLTHREIHFSDPLRRIWSEDPFISGYSDATVEVMIPIRCVPTHRDTTLGHHIQGCVGASIIEQ